MATGRATTWSQVDDVVGIGDDVEVVIDDDDGCALVEQALQNSEEGADVEGVQADAGPVEDEDRCYLVAVEFGAEHEALSFSSGERRGLLAKGEVAETEVHQHLELVVDLAGVAEVFDGLGDREAEDVGERQSLWLLRVCRILRSRNSMLRYVNTKSSMAAAQRDRISIAALGARVRAERHGHRMSLDDMAARSGVSRSMVSAIERGMKVPTVLVLDRIANALGISVSRLLDEERSETAILLTVDEQKIVNDGDGWHRRIVSPVIHRVDFEMARVSFDAGIDAGEFSAHPPGWTEYVAVESGELEIILSGDQRYVLATGDSLYFESNVSHAFKNPGGSETVAYIAMNGTGARR